MYLSLIEYRMTLVARISVESTTLEAAKRYDKSKTVYMTAQSPVTARVAQSNRPPDSGAFPLLMPPPATVSVWLSAALAL